MRDSFLDLALGSGCLGCGSPGRAVCRTCGELLPLAPEDVFVARPDPMPAGLVSVLAAAEYAGIVRRLIVRHKEEQSFALARPLGSLLAAPLSVLLQRWPAGTRPLVVPVPSRAATVRSRGHDPLERIVRAAIRRLDRPPALSVVPLLGQRGRTADQSGLSASERAANLADAFSVRPPVFRRVARACTGPSAGVAAIICDDVVTTGATVREAQRALEAVGVPVAAVVVVAATRLRHRR